MTELASGTTLGTSGDLLASAISRGRVAAAIARLAISKRLRRVRGEPVHSSFLSSPASRSMIPVLQIPISGPYARALPLVKKLRDPSLCALKIALIYCQGLLGCDPDFMLPPSRRAEAWQKAPPEIHK